MGGVPNLFLVGVQRSATTALWTYLGQHPEIFMAPKELHHLGSDLGRHGSTVNRGERPDRAQYLAYYERATDERYLGDASVGYIYSATAAREIKELSPDARIVVSVRNPIDMAHSLHSLMTFQGAEWEPDLERAVADGSNPRWAFTSWPFRWAFTYPRLLRFAEQIKRYHEVFGADRVHVVVYEDFAADPAAEYTRLLEFLGVDPSFLPTFPVVFGNRETRSTVLARWLKRTPVLVRGVGRVLVPSQAARRRLGKRAITANQRVVPRPTLDPAARSRLQETLSTEVDELGTLLGRDLGTQWFNPVLAPT